MAEPLDDTYVAHHRENLSDRQKIELLQVEFMAASMMLHEKCEHEGDFSECRRGICRDALKVISTTSRE